MKSRLMNLSSSVKLGGVEYKINTDFRVWIKIERLLFDVQSEPTIRLASIFALAYPVLPPKPCDAVKGIVSFYLGEEVQSEQRETEAHSVPPCYDLTEDFDYIWGAFMAQYGIDLTECQLHWWKFRALLACLNDDCRFLKIVAYRAVDTSVIRDKELRRFYQRMKKTFGLKGERYGKTGEDVVASSLESLF